MNFVPSKHVPRLDEVTTCCGDRTRRSRRVISPWQALAAVGIVALLLWLSACAGRPLPLVTEADVEFASARWPELPAGSLEKGRQLYLSKCASCHRPIDPSRYTAAEWPTKIAEMNKEKRVDDQSLKLIEAYLLSVASRPPVVAEDGGR